MANYNFQYLPIKASEVPIAKTYTIGTSTYIFSFTYNSRFDFYTVVISDLDNNILFSTKIVYGEQLYDALVDGLRRSYQKPGQPVRTMVWDGANYLGEI